MKPVLLFLMLTPALSFAKMYSIPNSGDDIIGELSVIYAEKMDSLIDVSIRYEAGVDELRWANPGLNMWTLGITKDPVTLPFKYILPNGKREGIVSNIPELRTYYFPRGEDVVYSYPVSVGRMDWKTPLGTWKVTVKQKDPPWHPPASIRREHAEMGRPPLPSVVPAGPDNPMGQYVLRLSIPSYLLHGTNDVTGIGMRVTHGCMRFFPDNIEELYNIVPSGTPVTFINQPIKYGWENNDLYIEVHPPLEEDYLSPEKMQQKALGVLSPLLRMPDVEINMDIVRIAVHQMSGIPVLIGSRQQHFSDTEEALQIFDDNESFDDDEQTISLIFDESNSQLNDLSRNRYLADNPPKYTHDPNRYFKQQYIETWIEPRTQYYNAEYTEPSDLPYTQYNGIYSKKATIPYANYNEPPFIEIHQENSD